MEQPKDEILEQPEQHLAMHPRQRASPAGGGKSLIGRKGEAREQKKTVGEHDQGQMSVQTILISQSS
ncbi:MAG TPA: hypothetical protein VFV38_17550 [Ktedonobacteraceae bacterium]|nr:hypothetical protein [Ktedonobacteraceae bacterium]